MSEGGLYLNTIRVTSWLLSPKLWAPLSD